jgi:hypothetical protein
MTLPNFLVIGAAKSGTSALHSYLWQHPDIYMSPNKEPNYFALVGRPPAFTGPGDDIINTRSVTDPVRYSELFEGATTEALIGESSNLYLYHPDAAERIFQAIPRVKLIAVLRNPIERAFSSYLHTKRDGREPEATFAAALADEPRRIAANWGHLWHYRSVGFYGRQLRRYYDRFPREQIAVYLYEDFDRDPAGTLADMFRFLGVDPSFTPDTGLRYNVSGKARIPWLQTWLTKPNGLKSALKPLLPAYTRQRLVQRAMQVNVDPGERPQLDAADRRDLAGGYEADIHDLQTLIGRDLSGWLRVG